MKKDNANTEDNKIRKDNIVKANNKTTEDNTMKSYNTAIETEDNTSGDNIVLIGMPGVGKSTIGVILAKILGYKFIDTDIVIQQEEQRLLREIIANEGVEGFIQIENRVNSGILCERAVIATGGSVVYGREAMEHLKNIGRVVYLRVDYDTINHRLGNLKGRGVVLKHGQDLRTLYDERIPLYEKYADLIVDETNCNIEETVEKLVNLL